MIKQIKEVVQSKPFLFALLAFLLPLLFYGNVFFGRSFAFDCAPGVMGKDLGYLQVPKENNVYCSTIIDPGAYVWQHPAQWTDVIRHYLQGQAPIWTQHIGLGFPLAANFQSGAFFILGFPFWLMFTLSKGNLFHLDMFFVFRYMMMSLGMYLFLRSFGIRRLVCYIGAFLYFNIGYFILIPNIAHHSVDMLLPFVGWSINNFYFTKKKQWVGIGIIILGLSLLAGMPEASIFTLFFAGLYVLFLSITFTKNKLRNFGYGLVLVFGGLLLAALLYIPGLEYLHLGMTIHHDTSGVIKSIPTEYLSTLTFPELFGGQITRDEGVKMLGETKYLSQGWNYVGFSAIFFFISSLFFIPTFLSMKEKRWGYSYFFFAILAVIMALQQYNILHIFIFEQFPVFAQTQYSKYSGALLSFSLITAGCIFLATAIKYQSKKVLIGFAVMLGICLYANYHYYPIVSVLPFASTLFGFQLNILMAVIFISIMTAAFVFLKNKRALLLIVLALVVLEMYAYLPKDGDMARRDSLTSVPPAFKYAKEHRDPATRILGVENILYPDLADIYNLNDMRMLDAIWTKRTYIFYKTFFYEPDAFRIIGINEGTNKQADILKNPFFDLFSVRYLFTYSPLESFTSGPTVTSLMSKRKEEFSTMFNISRFKINNDEKDVVFMHAPGDKTFPLLKPKGAASFTLYPMLDPTIFHSGKGDGITMVATILDKDGKVLATNQRYINPASRKSDQVWKKLIVGPLPDTQSSYPVQLHLETLPGKDNAFDGVGWGGFYWDNYEKLTQEKYKMVYNAEMNIYEKKDYLPRIHFVDTSVCVPPDDKADYANVISVMRKHASAIRFTAIRESKECGAPETYSAKRAISDQKYTDNQLSFTYSSPNEQYIVVQDAYYPGWKAYVNGKEIKIDPVNVTFRGFKVPAGENMKVIMAYQPWTFRLGLIISIVTFGVAIYFIRSKEEIA